MLNRHTRRRFLMGASGTLVALPLLPSLRPRTLRAASSTDAPQRFICVYTPNGYYRDHWLGSGNGSSYTAGPGLSALEPWRGKTLLLHGLSGPGGHYNGHTESLTGYANEQTFAARQGPSLDLAVAEHLAPGAPLSWLGLGVATTSDASGIISYSSSGLPLPNITNPRSSFDQVMAVGNVDPATAEGRRQQRRSVLDSVSDDLLQLQSQLPTEERALLDEHLTLLREQERRLDEPMNARSCEAPDPAKPANGSRYGFDETCRYHIDALAAAVRCDVTRVATLMIGATGDSTYYDFAGVNDDHHQVAHGDTSDAESKYLSILRWQSEQLAYLLSQLDAIPEGDGTALDHTLVFWTNEIGLHRFTHSRDDMGIVLAGSPHLIQQGQLMDLSGARYTDLLLTLGRTLGLQSSTFGADGKTLLEGIWA